jgi:TolA-binding protein
MRVDPADDPALDPAAQRVADFVSAEVGPPASTPSSEKAFLRRLARYRQTQRNRRRLTVGAAVASVLVVGLAGSRFREQAPAAAVLNYRVDNQNPPSGGYLAPQTAESLLAFSDGSKVQMAAQARGRVVEVSSRGARFALDAGQATAEIVHRPRAQWIFDVGPFRVTVHGTSFTMAWNPVDAVFEVRLASGAISVASPVAGPEIQMRAGQTLRVSLRDQSSTLGSLGTMSGGREVSSPAKNTKTAPASSSFEPPRTAPGGPPEPPRWSHRGWMSALSQNRARDILADAERRGPTSVLERADSDDLWALASAARYAGRPALAGQALNAHRRRFPSTDHSREAAFLLGRLHDGDPDPAEALRWYDRYLVDAHDGVGVADALGRKMTLLERSNRRAEALAVAREYLRRSPQGTYANAARGLVRSSTTGP